MQSCIYEGEVWHERLRPVSHRLRYRLFMLYLDLDELPELAKNRLFRGNAGIASASFAEQDYLTEAASPGKEKDHSLADRVRALVETETGNRPRGPIRLLCQLRYWGYYFSPLNLYYCFAADGTTLETVVAEVNNIPWRERHWYVLGSHVQTPAPIPPADGENGALFFRHPKDFHVSPFMPMDQQYRWEMGTPADFLRVRLENWDRPPTITGVNTPENFASAGADLANTGGELATELAPLSSIFTASLVMRRKPLTRFRLGLNLFCHGWMSAKVVAAIYFEAFRLWLKKAPYYAHPPTLPKPLRVEPLPLKP